MKEHHFSSEDNKDEICKTAQDLAQQIYQISSDKTILNAQVAWVRYPQSAKAKKYFFSLSA